MLQTNEQEITTPDVDWHETLSEDEVVDFPEVEVESQPLFICDCDEWYRSAFAGLPFYQEHEGKRYCVLHHPGKEKADDFRIVFEEKKAKGDFDFKGVWFPEEINFKKAYFHSEASFISATFEGLADFSLVTFTKVATFSDATFTKAANFSDVTFT
jgi:hypothetical protein